MLDYYHHLSTENICKRLPLGAESEGKNCVNLDFYFDVLETPKMTFSKANGISLLLNKAEVHVKSTIGGKGNHLLKSHISIKVCTVA